ncbi:MAG: RHS repeat protein, partial [Lachnospiraceae bacterium]|nr:RHS repeat protein [Lachnospiraceae bacterium]
QYIFYESPLDKLRKNNFSLSNEEDTCNYLVYEYDVSGNLIKEVDREGNITSYKYDNYGNVIEKIYPNNSSNIYEYDVLNRLTKTYFKETNESDSILLEEKSYVNAINSTITTKTYINNAEFKTKIETYNCNGQLTTVQNENATSTITYYANGLINTEMDANDGKIIYYYDKINRLTRKYELLSDNKYKATFYVYDNLSRMIEEKVGKSFIADNEVPDNFISIYYEYDGNSNIIRKTTSSGEESLYTYDAYNNVIKEKIKLKEDTYRTKTYEYNYLNKKVKETDESLVATYEYDNVGNLIKTTTGENIITEYEYNKNYQITKKKLDGHIEEEIIYDNMGNVIS